MRRVQSPIGSIKRVIARYTSANGQNNASGSVVNYEVKVFDPFGTVTTGASWVFTAPYDGYYFVNAAFTWAAFDASVQTQISLRRNGSTNVTSFNDWRSTGAGYRKTEHLCQIIQLARGNTVDVTQVQNSGAGKALEADSTTNWIDIFLLDTITGG